ncbi:sensor domain-containing diguanylate cyclase [Zhengella mangrovi]|nr:sensor domain-containing diguanylate cyclase [Zhengella mangrovi]
MEGLKRQLLTELARQNSVLEVVMACVAQGIALYDRKLNLVLHNEKYLSIYDVPQETSLVGTSKLDMLSMRSDRGAYSEKHFRTYLQQIHAMLSRREPMRAVCELTNGKVIEVNAAPMEDGGWLCTHHDITTQHKLQKTIEHIACTDELTGLYNRRVLEKTCLDALSDCKPGCGTAVALLDLNGFKQINDAYGHFAGDLILKQVASRLRAGTRREDTIIRLGGDEFAVIQPRIGTAADAEDAARGIMERFQEEFEVDGRHVFVGSSIGISYCDTGKTDLQHMLVEADKALYRSKESGEGSLYLVRFGANGPAIKLLAQDDAGAGMPAAAIRAMPAEAVVWNGYT